MSFVEGMSAACSIGDPTHAATGCGFVQEVCLPFLLHAQNIDGGWGYRPGSDSAVEPTCWTLIALTTSQSSQHQEGVPSALKWLCDAQLPSGSWPAFPAQPVGCWTTSAACLALNACHHAPGQVARGRQWLCDWWPAEGALWRRWAASFLGRNTVVGQDSSLRGWGWTPGTASWVEPTAATLLALRCNSSEPSTPDAARRQSLAARMLYDRMCLRGGWNSGNPLVYQVPGEPRIGPTAWALLALREFSSRAENHLSIKWLESSYEAIRGPVSLALAHICLTAYGETLPPVEPALAEMHSKNQFLNNVSSVAWAAIAARGGGICLLGEGSRQ
jgi:hypothetical protein